LLVLEAVDRLSDDADRLLPPDALFEDDVLVVEEERPLDEVPSLSALRLRF
jgi:hypothetical protein